MPDGSLDAIGKTLAQIPSGCSIVTAVAPSGSTGMLASWVQQAGFDPPMVSVAIKKGRPIETFIDESGFFVINLLADPPTAMFKHFGRGFSPQDDAFKGLSTRAHGAGVVLNDAAGWLAVRVFGKYDAGDHWLYVASVEDAAVRGDVKPYVHLRKNGLNY